MTKMIPLITRRSSTRATPCESAEYGSIRRICATYNKNRPSMACLPHHGIVSGLGRVGGTSAGTAYAGLRAGDFVTTLGSVVTAAPASPAVGSSYAITASGAAVASAASNSYRIVYVPGTLSVAARLITITANAQSRAYDDTNPRLTYTIGGRGLVNSDTLSGTLATTAVATSNVGSYAITQGGLTTANNSNYAITYTGANLAVTQAPLTITADNQSKVYGAALPTLTASYNGFVNGDTATGLTTGPTLTTNATAASHVAGNPYSITASGAVDSDYTIS
jgi:hypothetical protein